MKFAIIIITHNRPKKVLSLLASIQRHTPQEHYIYLLDNGSTLSFNEAEQIKNDYSVNYFKTSKNLWPSKARNFLINKLNDEEFVVTIDDDMLVTPHWLDELYKLLISEEKAAGVCPRIIQQGLNKIHSQGGFYKIQNDFIIFQEYYRMLPISASPTMILDCGWLPSGCSLYYREVLNKYKYDENMPNMEDPLHSYEIKQNNYKLYSTPYSVVIHTAGASANKYLRSNENITKSICYFHHKTGLNPIKSWSMHTRVLRGRIDVDTWLYRNKIKLGLINSHTKQKKYPASSTSIAHKNIAVNSNNKLLSIVIPFRHAHNFLPLLIKSIEAQTLYESIETIIVNLGSRSSISFIGASAKEVIVPYKGTYNNAYACNIGAKQARGKYILFLSPDCLMHSNFISSLLECKFINQEYFAANIPTANLSREFTNEIMAKKELVFERYKSALLKPVFTNKILFVDRMDFMDVGGFDERFFGKSYEIKDYIRRVSNKVDCNAISSECIEKNIIAFQLYSQESMSKEIISHNVRIMASKSPNAFKRKSELFGRLDRFPVFKTSYKVSEIYS